MNKSMLITRPENDDMTLYLSIWSHQLIERAKRSGFEVFDLHRERANKKDVEGIIKSKEPLFLVFNGHGNETIITGHKAEPLIILGKNHNLLNSKIVFSISCRSAKELGKQSVDEHGAITFTGFEDDFVLLYDHTKISRPMSDDTAALFLQPPTEFTSSIIKGSTTGESFQKAKTLFKNNFIKALSGNSDTSELRFLWWDYVHFVSLGDQNARIN